MGEQTTVGMDKSDYVILEPGDSLCTNDLSGCTVLAVNMDQHMGFMAHFSSSTLSDSVEGQELVRNVGVALSQLLNDYRIEDAWLIVSEDARGERFSAGNDLIRAWLTNNNVSFQGMRYRSDQAATHTVELRHGKDGNELVAPTSM